MTGLRARWAALWSREGYPSRDHLRLGLLLAVALAMFTTNKLYWMAAERGWVPGARSESVTILRKDTSPAKFGVVYRLHWEDARGRADWGNLPESQWEAIAVGDEIEIRWVGLIPDAEIVGGFGADDGNFVVDGVILLLELAAAGWLWGRLRAPRA